VTLIVHIGSPKTATSTLQNAFFPAHPGLFFLGKNVDRARAYEGWRTPPIGALMKQIEAGGLDFAPDPQVTRILVESVARESGGRPVVLSDEGLSVFTGVDGMAKLRRVMDIFAPLAPFRVIFCVRDQLSLIKSNYLTEHRGEMTGIPGTRQNWYPDFDHYLDIHFRYVCGAFLDSFRYAAMIDRYAALVGEGNILVYAFEDFRADPITVLQRLCRFIGIDERDPCLARTTNVRENEHQMERLYTANRLRARLTGGRGLGPLLPPPLKAVFRNWLVGGKKFDVTPSPEAARRIKDYYRADNESLLAKHGIRL